MTIIECRECGKKISDSASACVGCGAPMAVAIAKKTNTVGTDRSFDFNGIKSTFSKISEKVAETADSVAEQSNELWKSRQQKDSIKITEKHNETDGSCNSIKTKSEENCEKFKAALESIIDIKFAEIMRGKENSEKHLTYVDGQIMTSSVRNIFKKALGASPSQVEVACHLSEAVLAPSAKERAQLIKSAVGIGGGTAGIGMMLMAIGNALGWGMSAFASAKALFVSASLTGPIGLGVAGIALAGVAAYFAMTNNKLVDTERFMKVLKNSSAKAVDDLWLEKEDMLVRVLNNESST